MWKCFVSSILVPKVEENKSRNIHPCKLLNLFNVYSFCLRIFSHCSSNSFFLLFCVTLGCHPGAVTLISCPLLLFIHMHPITQSVSLPPIFMPSLLFASCTAHSSYMYESLQRNILQNLPVDHFTDQQHELTALVNHPVFLPTAHTPEMFL